MMQHTDQDKDKECIMFFIPCLPIPPSSQQQPGSQTKLPDPKSNTHPPRVIASHLTAKCWSELYGLCLVTKECFHPDCEGFEDCQIGDCHYMFQGHTIHHPTGLTIVCQKFEILTVADTIVDKDFAMFSDCMREMQPNPIYLNIVPIPQSWSLKASEEVTVLQRDEFRVGKIYSIGSCDCAVEFAEEDVHIAPLC